MIRVWLLVAVVAVVAVGACSKSSRTSHEEAPVPRPLDAPAAIVPPAMDAQVIDAMVVDAMVVDAQAVDAAPRPDASAPRPDAAVAKPGPKLGKLGDVCAKGSRGKNLDEGPMSSAVLTCGPGLICCYPCGIPGCDSICKKTCPAVP